MQTIRAVYENGVVQLPEGTLVEFEPRPATQAKNYDNSLEGIYVILKESYLPGEREVAARHDEHRL